MHESRMSYEGKNISALIWTFYLKNISHSGNSSQIIGSIEVILDDASSISQMFSPNFVFVKTMDKT